jgi:hypothetical protein
MKYGILFYDTMYENWRFAGKYRLHYNPVEGGSVFIRNVITHLPV